MWWLTCFGYCFELPFCFDNTLLALLTFCLTEFIGFIDNVFDRHASLVEIMRWLTSLGCQYAFIGTESDWTCPSWLLDPLNRPEQWLDWWKSAVFGLKYYYYYYDIDRRIYLNLTKSTQSAYVRSRGILSLTPYERVALRRWVVSEGSVLVQRFRYVWEANMVLRGKLYMCVCVCLGGCARVCVFVCSRYTATILHRPTSNWIPSLTRTLSRSWPGLFGTLLLND